MCSVYGYISSRQVDINVFQKYLKHRGPDGTGIFKDNSLQLVLGHGRLSIIDLSSFADQPMVDDTGNYVIVFNGEIYNYKEIRTVLSKSGATFRTNSDTEILLEAYKRYGRNCLPMLRGMFAFAIYCKKTGTLFLARDRFGIKPLYYSFYNNQFVFSSEVTPIVESGLVPKKLSHQGLDDYFYYGSVQQPNTIYESINSLMPASFMELDAKKLTYTTGTYYDYIKEARKLSLERLSYAEAVHLVREKLEEATRYHLVADVEVGAFLSGGVDSSAVVALMSKYSTKPIRTYSVGFSAKKEVEDESAIAKQTAATLNCNHSTVIVDDRDIPTFYCKYVKSLDQPSIDGFNTFLVSNAAGREVKVVLSGLGGDEIFAGYEHFELIKKSAEQKPSLSQKLFQHVNNIRPNKYTSSYAYYDQDPCTSILQLRSTQNFSLRKGLLMNPPERNMSQGCEPGLTTLQKISKCEINHYLLNTLLRDSDVMSMAHSLECRPVLLDHELVETAFALPDEYKIRDGVKKSVFIDAVKDIIPPHVYQRKKSGFEMPLESWMNQSLRSYAMDALTSETARSLFSKGYLAKEKNRLKNSKLKRNFWNTLALLSWINHSKASL